VRGCLRSKRPAEEGEQGETIQQAPPKRFKLDDGYEEWLDDTDGEVNEVDLYLKNSPGDDSDILLWWKSNVSDTRKVSGRYIILCVIIFTKNYIPGSNIPNPRESS